MYRFGIQKVQTKREIEIANGKNSNDTCKTYTRNKRLSSFLKLALSSCIFKKKGDPLPCFDQR